mgnify:CR=1 FL=1
MGREQIQGLLQMKRKYKIYKRYRRGKSGGQRYWKIYPSIRLGMIPKKYVEIKAWVPLEKNSNDIFIGNWQEADRLPIKSVAGTIAHEELHNTLKKEIGPEASAHLDLITVPAIMTSEGRNKIKLLNPSTESTIMPTKKILLESIKKAGVTRKNLHQWYESQRKSVELSKRLINKHKL